jgi:response regulator RpfG family c-di-GMP phosphodiesterase
VNHDAANHAILLVDDDPNILASYRRSLGRRHQVTIAEGGPAALRLLDSGAHFAVIITDQTMPEMDGVRFLVEASRRRGDTVHIMLTGNLDQKTAADAINLGRVFRFLNKPCDPETLEQAIAAALRQYDLVTAEKILLRKTVTGSVRLLTDLLGHFEPRLFARAERVRQTAGALAAALALPQPWRFELAGLLSPLGMLTVPRDVLERHQSGAPLSQDEAAVIDGHAQLTARLLRHIPRLEPVADLIAPPPQDPPSNAEPNPDRAREAQILPLALELDRRILAGQPFAEAVESLRGEHHFHESLLDALARLSLPAYAPRERTDLLQVDVRKLKEGMVLHSDIRSTDGRLLVAAGSVISASLLERLVVFRRLGKIEGNATVSIPPPDEEAAQASRAA